MLAGQGPLLVRPWRGPVDAILARIISVGSQTSSSALLLERNISTPLIWHALFHPLDDVCQHWRCKTVFEPAIPCYEGPGACALFVEL